MSINTCLIYRCLSSASAVIRSWFIYELQKSTTIAFSRNSLYTFYSRNPTCGIPLCLRISNRKYPPCPQNSIIVNPPSPSEILKAVRGMVWIFSGIAHYLPWFRLCFCYIPVFLQLLQVDALRTVYFIFSSANCLSQPHVIQVSIFILFCWNSTMCMCVKSELRLQNLILGLTPLSIHH